MEFRRQLGVLRRWFWLLVGSMVLAGGAAYLVSINLPKVYEGKVTLIVGQSTQAANPDLNQLLASQRLSQTYAELATTSPLLEQVIAKNGLDVTPRSSGSASTAERPARLDPGPLDGRGSAIRRAPPLSPTRSRRRWSPPHPRSLDATRRRRSSSIPTSPRFRPRSRRHRPRSSDSRASPSDRTSDEQQLQALQGRIVTLRQTYATMLAFSSNSGANLLTVVDPASPPAEPASPRVLLNTVIAASSDCCLPSAWRSCSNPSTTPSSPPDDVEAVAGLPTLGTITKMDGQRGGKEFYQLATLLHHRGPSPKRIAAFGRTSSSRPSMRPVRHAARHQRHPGRGQDDDRRKPRRRVCAGRPADDPPRRRLPQARRPSHLRSPERAGAVEPAALGCRARIDDVAQTTDQENLQDHHHRSAPAEPGGAAWIEADADGPRAPRRSRRPRRRRQPTTPGGDRRRASRRRSRTARSTSSMPVARSRGAVRRGKGGAGPSRRARSGRRRSTDCRERRAAATTTTISTARHGAEQEARR